MSGKHARWLLWLWLGCALPLTAAAQDDDLGDEDDKPSSSQSADEGEDTGEAKPEEAAAPAKEAPSGPSVWIQPYAGIGMAMRSFQRPSALGVQKLDASAVPGVEVGLGVVAWPKESFSLGFNLAYQTALGFTVTESPPLALQNHVRARSERVALDIAPTWHFGNVSFGVALGVSVRVLWPEAHLLMTPGYSLTGPHGRLELNVQVNELVSLRLAPEGQWIVLIDRDLKATGVNAQGMAVGGELGVNFTLSSHFLAGVSFRESHALISTTTSTQFKDVERYLMLRGTGTF